MLLAPKSILMTQIVLYLCYNIVHVMKAPVVWVCRDEDHCNDVMTLAKPILADAVVSNCG